MVPTGRFTQTEINRIPAKIWNKLVKATGLVNKQKMPAESRNIQSIINTLSNHVTKEEAVITSKQFRTLRLRSGARKIHHGVSPIITVSHVRSDIAKLTPTTGFLQS